MSTPSYFVCGVRIDAGSKPRDGTSGLVGD